MSRVGKYSSNLLLHRVVYLYKKAYPCISPFIKLIFLVLQFVFHFLRSSNRTLFYQVSKLFPNRRKYIRGV